MLKDILATHPLLRKLSPDTRSLLHDCAIEVSIKKDEYLLKTGENADRFYLVQHGSVALQIYDPRIGSIEFMTVQENDVVGWSWMFPPCRWHFDAMAKEDVSAVQVDGVQLLLRCETDYRIGYQLMSCFSQIMMERLVAARLQMLDLYGERNPEETERGTP
ncbi:MAG: Crp/Fnr family transcriptional regulator [Verrucomicrobia bacterium]|nr:MAG: Crp/Fnr family transcriptional regulator [Verrucomicrobiota bacterium]